MHKNLQRRPDPKKFLKDIITTISEFAIEFLIVFSLLIVSSLLLYILVHFVIPEKENIIDDNAFLFFRPLISPALIKIAKLVTFFGTGTFLIPSYIFIIVYLVRNNYIKYAFMTSTIAISSLLLGWALKDIFHRSRPPHHLVSGAGGYSFPSGHALGGFIFTGVVLYFIWQTRKSYYVKWIFSILMFVWGTIIGISRVFLHVHYATDVLGSLFIALLWFSLMYIFFLFLYRHEMNDRIEEKEIGFISTNYHLNN
jgi:undecaprenyl-diphosphatase